MKSAWVNGRFDDCVSVYDEGFLIGMGVFETMGVFSGELPLWHAHLSRMEQGAGHLGIPWRVPERLREFARELLAKEAGDDVLRLSLTAGDSERPTWCMTTRRRTTSSAPMRLFPSSYRRHPGDPLAAVKCTSYAFHRMAQREARAAGAGDALILGDGERILETTTGNVFFEHDGAFHTPRLDGSFLAGIARAVVLAGLEAEGVAVQESDYTLAQLRESDAIFTTNAVYGPRPAVVAGGAAAPLDPRVVEAWQRGLRSGVREGR